MFDYKRAMSTGHQYNVKVARHLTERGIPCHAPDLKFARTSAEVQEMTRTEKDVVLDTLDGHLEVKARNVHFHTVEDFKYPTIIVDTTYGFSAKEQKPLAYVMISKPTNRMFVLPVSTQELWTQESRYDYERGHDDLFYFADTDLIQPLKALIDYLKNPHYDASGSVKPF